jgi:hypothetical protein
MRILKAGLLYFALVFAAGFVLGTFRTLWVVPAIGTRVAELIEAPIMTGISAIMAAFVVRRLSVPWRVSERLGFGVLAVVLMLAAEFTFVLRLRGISFRDYVTDLDPLAGSAYYLALVLFAAMPLFVARH